MMAFLSWLLATKYTVVHLVYGSWLISEGYGFWWTLLWIFVGFTVIDIAAFLVEGS